MPAIGLTNPEAGALLSYIEVAEQWAALKARPEQEFILYCEGSVFSAFDLFVLYELGQENIRLYETSLTGWGVDLDYPMETGSDS